MRQIILDTETTGLDPNDGHRVIEIGCIEMVNRRLTDRTFHVYINPEREIDQEAIAVHGITNEFLTDKPNFSGIADEFIEFVRDAELIAHNAPFDVSFLEAELERIPGAPSIFALM
ncbi:MAG: DNA polymerase III subunit epsilon, partial [Litorivicinaceae bacterium]